MNERLIQFQCQHDGSIFYYQTSIKVPSNRQFVCRCPLCGSKRIEETGRTFAPVNAAKPFTLPGKGRDTWPT